MPAGTPLMLPSLATVRVVALLPSLMTIWALPPLARLLASRATVACTLPLARSGVAITPLLCSEIVMTGAGGAVVSSIPLALPLAETLPTLVLWLALILIEVPLAGSGMAR